MVNLLKSTFPLSSKTNTTVLECPPQSRTVHIWAVKIEIQIKFARFEGAFEPETYFNVDMRTKNLILAVFL